MVVDHTNAGTVQHWQSGALLVSASRLAWQHWRKAFWFWRLDLNLKSLKSKKILVMHLNCTNNE